MQRYGRAVKPSMNAQNGTLQNVTGLRFRLGETSCGLQDSERRLVILGLLSAENWYSEASW